MPPKVLPLIEPALSLLLPAYNYAAGIEKTLACLMASKRRGDVEVIVFDDGQSHCVADLIDTYRLQQGLNVRYEQHRPALGAVANWNALLDAASGQYCLLMHHDEFPMGPGFFDRLLALLAEYRYPPVMLMACQLVDAQGHIIRTHVPTWLQRRILEEHPAYLFRRNVIGPSAALVVKRSAYPRFDPRLRWLVDVDCYHRLRRDSPNWVYTDALSIGSIQGRGDSITAGLGTDIPALLMREHALLRREHVDVPDWVWAGGSKPLLRLLERAAWGLFRVLQSVYERARHRRHR